MRKSRLAHAPRVYQRARSEQGTDSENQGGCLRGAGQTSLRLGADLDRICRMSFVCADVQRQHRFVCGFRSSLKRQNEPRILALRPEISRLSRSFPAISNNCRRQSLLTCLLTGGTGDPISTARLLNTCRGNRVLHCSLVSRSPSSQIRAPHLGRRCTR